MSRICFCRASNPMCCVPRVRLTPVDCWPADVGASAYARFTVRARSDEPTECRRQHSLARIPHLDDRCECSERGHQSVLGRPRALQSWWVRLRAEQRRSARNSWAVLANPRWVVSRSCTSVEPAHSSRKYDTNVLRVGPLLHSQPNSEGDEPLPRAPAPLDPSAEARSLLPEDIVARRRGAHEAPIPECPTRGGSAAGKSWRQCPVRYVERVAPSRQWRLPEHPDARRAYPPRATALAPLCHCDPGSKSHSPEPGPTDL